MSKSRIGKTLSLIKLSKSAYFHNLNQIANKIGKKERIFIVLKDNAYGHGMMQIAPLASEFGIKRAVTRALNEAQAISHLFDEILILSHFADGSEDTSDKYIYAINDISALKALKSGVRALIALDTLMHRHGLNESELQSALKIAKERNIRICGAYTHYSSADMMSASFSVQREMFIELKSRFKELCKGLGFNDLFFSSANSAACERLNSADFGDEYVRIGIAQFGYGQFDESLGLKPVLSLWAQRLSARILKKGQSVGYGGAFTASKDMKIATYDLGYGDGLLRYNGTGELRLANGEPMLGKMSMDSFSCADSGEQICVFNDAKVCARYFNTINYDILVKLMPNITRVVVE